jgi:hypothetical protein
MKATMKMDERTILVLLQLWLDDVMFGCSSVLAAVSAKVTLMGGVFILFFNVFIE